MNTRSGFQNLPLGGKHCVYCAKPADTKDHTPPRCLLRRPLPVNLITLPACNKCNNGFSFHERAVRAFLTVVSVHPEMATKRQEDGWLDKACGRSRRLRRMMEESRQPSGNYAVVGDLLSSFEQVFRKTAQGLFFALYHRVAPAELVQLIRLEDRRTITPDEVIAQIRPNALRHITDEPLSEISPHSWHTREPIIILKLEPLSGGPPIQRAFRLVRETPVEWICLQQDIFSFAFVKCEDGGTACVFDLWKTLLITVRTPWPDDRGPMRRGRKNPLSRDDSRRTKRRRSFKN